MTTIVITANDDLGLDGEMALHFGHCPYFVIAEVDAERHITATRVQANPYAEQHQPGQIPQYIKSLGADVMLAGGMGGKAIEWFEQLGVEVASGAYPTVNAALTAYLGGQLSGVTECQHDHDHDHHH
jgi:predicted Fe-Mo cluster-binding NifX family protein